MENYNYFSSYGDYGSPSDLIPKKTVDEITANAPKELDTFKEVADKISEIESGGSGSSADVEALSQTVEQNKAEADAKFDEIDNALEGKADASEIENLATKDELEQVKTDVQTIVQDAPDTLDTLKEIADLLATKQDAAEVVEALGTKVDTEDFNEHISANDEAFAAINETMASKLDADALQDYVKDANYVHTDNNYTNEEKNKLADLSNYDDTALTERVETIENANYVEDANYVHTDNNYTTEEKNKLESLNNYDDTELAGRVTALEGANYVEDANYVHTDNNYTNEEKSKLDELDNYDDTALAGRVTALENANYVTTEMMNGAIDTATQSLISVETDPTVPEWAKAETKPTYTAAEVGAMSTEHPSNSITAEKMAAWDNKADSDTNTTVTGVDVINDDDEGRVFVINSSDNTSVSVSVSKIFDEGNYYTTTETDNIFVSKSQYEDDLNDYASDSDLANAVHELVVRLNKLEAQNAILVEKGTDSADDITGMTDGDALNADIVVATDEAIEALSTPKTFNSITIAGGEVGDNTVINLLAKDSIDVNGLTVSGTKGVGNGKIVYGSNNITISNVNIEPGCTVYNVFEGKQDKAEDNLVENFTATNVVVDDIDLMHNVFNIYQLADGANILVKDSVFNLNVANSNVMRVSNITNAKNVTITFENVEWSYDEKGYTPSDYAWAGLLIYQPYSTDDGADSSVAMENKSVHTWTINVKNCRYNGEPITTNLVGTIKQAVYQYDVNKSGISESPDVFGSVNFD